MSNYKSYDHYKLHCWVDPGGSRHASKYFVNNVKDLKRSLMEELAFHGRMEHFCFYGMNIKIRCTKNKKTCTIIDDLQKHMKCLINDEIIIAYSNDINCPTTTDYFLASTGQKIDYKKYSFGQDDFENYIDNLAKSIPLYTGSIRNKTDDNIFTYIVNGSIISRDDYKVVSGIFTEVFKCNQDFSNLVYPISSLVQFPDIDHNSTIKLSTQEIEKLTKNIEKYEYFIDWSTIEFPELNASNLLQCDHKIYGYNPSES